jgi:putative tryptophan/tyrosine transport system substrate-binding protein
MRTGLLSGRSAFRALAGAFLLFGFSGSEVSRNVVILRSGDVPIYNYAVEGFMGALSSKKISFTVKDVILPSQEAQVESFIGAIDKDRPDLVFTIGTAASRAARERLKMTPFIYSMIVDPSSYGLSSAGAVMEVKPSAQVEFIRKSFPFFKRIGLVYSPERNKNVVRLFQELNLPEVSLVMIQANSSEQMSQALQRLAKEADCLLMIADAVLYSPQTATQIILQTLQNNLPIIAVSPSFVKAGALAAIYPDYQDNGARAGEAAARFFSGERMESIPVQWPAKTRTAVNLIVARRLGVNVPTEVIEAAEQVVK